MRVVGLLLGAGQDVAAPRGLLSTTPLAFLVYRRLGWVLPCFHPTAGEFQRCISAGFACSRWDGHEGWEGEETTFAIPIAWEAGISPYSFVVARDQY
jgi:hypothetical protein